MKFTKQEARKILGVTKESSKDEIEKRYDIALKKYRAMKAEGTLEDKAQLEFDNSTEAYRILMGYIVDEPKVEKKETYADKAFEKAGIDRKKANNFFYYYKFHILIAIVAIIVIGLSVKSIVTKVDPDITIGLMGIVNQQETESFGEKIKEQIPEIKEIAFDTALLTGDPNDQQAYVYMQKAMVMLAATDIEVFIVNKYAFDLYAQNGAFMKLEDIADNLGIDTSNSENLKIRVVDEWEELSDMNAERKPKTYVDAEPQLYGIDVSNSEFLKDVNIIGPEKILVVKAAKADEGISDLAKKIIKLLAK